MPPKKAAKKVGKKAAKKSAKPQGNDLRRAYEHLHRVNILYGGLPEHALRQIDTLTRLAQSSLAAGDDKGGADLLRTGEHLAFGSLATQAGDPSVATDLTSASQDEYDRLLERGAAHWAEREGSSPRGIATIYKLMLAEAKAAMKAGALHRGLEFARGAEALSHVEAVAVVLGSGNANRGRLRD